MNGISSLQWRLGGQVMLSHLAHTWIDVVSSNCRYRCIIATKDDNVLPFKSTLLIGTSLFCFLPKVFAESPNEITPMLGVADRLGDRGSINRGQFHQILEDVMNAFPETLL